MVCTTRDSALDSALTISRNGPERTGTPHYFMERNGSVLD